MFLSRFRLTRVQRGPCGGHRYAAIDARFGHDPDVHADPDSDQDDGSDEREHGEYQRDPADADVGHLAAAMAGQQPPAALQHGHLVQHPIGGQRKPVGQFFLVRRRRVHVVIRRRLASNGGTHHADTLNSLTTYWLALRDRHPFGGDFAGDADRVFALAFHSGPRDGPANRTAFGVERRVID